MISRSAGRGRSGRLELARGRGLGRPFQVDTHPAVLFVALLDHCSAGFCSNSRSALTRYIFSRLAI